MGLIHAVDAAYPHLDAIPAQATVVLGYVGGPGYTPHVWTLAEVAAVRSAGRQFWPIWVPPQGAMLDATGRSAASGMQAALPTYGIDKATPCFLDVEQKSWEASAGGAQAAIAGFKQAMRAAGYAHPYAYVPHAAGIDWIASWTNAEPASLPAGVIGQQYQSTATWDYSVFDAGLLQTAPTTPTEEDDLSATDVTNINGHIDDTATHIIHQLEASVEQRLTDHNAAMEQKIGAMLNDLATKLGTK